MSNWVRFTDLIKDETFSKKFIFYAPEERSQKFTEEETGWDEFQRVRTENNLGWNPIKVGNDKIGIISSKATSYNLGLCGEKGFKNSLTLLQRFAEMYENKELKAKGIALSKAIFDTLPEDIKYVYKYYWLADQYTSEVRIHVKYYGVRFVGLFTCHEGDIYNSEGREFRPIHSMRPVILLPKDILVDIGDEKFDGSDPERGLILKLNN